MVTPRHGYRALVLLLTLGTVLAVGCSRNSAQTLDAGSSALVSAPASAQSPAVNEPIAAIGGLPQQIADSPTATDSEDVNDLATPAISQVTPTADFPSYPLPDGNPPPLGPGTFGPAFRAPLPPSPVWNPPGPKRVALQAGHFMTDNVPAELARLSPGTSAGGWQEWQVNLTIAEATATILEAAGVDVDILPTTVPIRYRAQAFVAIHADGDTSGALHGFKITRSGFSSIPAADDQLVSDMNDAYAADTGLPRDDAHISLRMTYYYAFNTRRYQHAIDLGTPAAIIEAGYLTNSGDRAQLTNHPEQSAQGIADGILRFLNRDLGAPE